MNKKCKCGGTLKKTDFSQIVIIWKCPVCSNVVTQRKRRPYKLNAEKDMVLIYKYITKLLERNPITSKNQEEWRKFTSLLLQESLTLDKMANKVIIEVIKTKRKKKGE